MKKEGEKKAPEERAVGQNPIHAASPDTESVRPPLRLLRLLRLDTLFAARSNKQFIGDSAMMEEERGPPPPPPPPPPSATPGRLRTPMSSSPKSYGF